MRRTIPIAVAVLFLFLTACSSPRLDDAELISVRQATDEDLQRIASAQEKLRRALFAGATVPQKDGSTISFGKDDYDSYVAYLATLPHYLPAQPRIDWPVLRIVFRSSRDLIEDDALSQTTAILCGESFESGYIGSNQLIWNDLFLTDKTRASMRTALLQSGNEEFEFFTPYRHRENHNIPTDAKTVTILPPPTDICLRRSGAYYEASAGSPLRIDRAKIIDALKPLPRTLDVHR